ncbi:hypothetical protein GCM10010399_82720 [Dactylosporangium fulvum]|uniref:Uncharacterized protein n=1 Tax=Dactylosporangium fulvum TaxID=53359 RepID=A0ABY5W8H4_9ACTN|nr:hypothetical protein [Dactylosporangium fulvum]UWP85857.1 hypothetical protein Dfulv_17060 [Dactylosporangium fulvum]
MTALRKVGERWIDPSAPYDFEWTGVEWAPVCPADDVAVTERRKDRWLYCGACGVRVDKLGRGQVAA